MKLLGSVLLSLLLPFTTALVSPAGPFTPVTDGKEFIRVSISADLQFQGRSRGTSTNFGLEKAAARGWDQDVAIELGSIHQATVSRWTDLDDSISSFLLKQVDASLFLLRDFVEGLVRCMHSGDLKKSEKFTYYSCDGDLAKQIVEKVEKINEQCFDNMTLKETRACNQFSNDNATDDFLSTEHGAGQRFVGEFGKILDNALHINQAKCEQQGRFFKSWVCFIQKSR